VSNGPVRGGDRKELMERKKIRIKGRKKTKGKRMNRG
jgi:hypothetical protein